MKKILSLFILLTVFSACPKPNSSTDLFDGKWQMESYSIFAPEQPVFSEGDVIWTFTSSSQSVEINNNLSTQYPYLKASGTYSYTEMAGAKITIDGRTFDYKFENNKLIISDKPELDGPMITFKKVVE